MANSPKKPLSSVVAAIRTVPAERVLQSRFDSLLEKVRQNRPGEDLTPLQDAFDFAAKQHQSQVRESGEPYLSHPLEVAHILADLRLDVTTLTAALLHDVVEDTKIATAAIASRFGADTARLVEGVTKISRLELASPEA